MFQQLVDVKLKFIIYFNLFFIRLTQSHDFGYEFGKLTRVNSGCFIDLFFMKFSQSHNSGCWFVMLTQIDPDRFLCSFFNHLFFNFII